MELIERLNILCRDLLHQILLMICMLPLLAHAELIQGVHPSKHRGPRLEVVHSRPIYLGRDVRPEDVIVASNRGAAMWGVRDEHENIVRLHVFSNGRIRVAECRPLVRDYWFVGAGELIGVDCGGAHFAGKEILYTTARLQKVDEFDQASVPPNRRPSWSASRGNASPN